MRLEYDDHYSNIYNGCSLPSDAILDDPVELAKLSGPCVIITKGADKDEETEV